MFIYSLFSKKKFVSQITIFYEKSKVFNWLILNCTFSMKFI